MSNQKTKKKSAVPFFLLCFLAIVIVMFIANRKSVLVKEIKLPFNNGIINLSTSRNFLVAAGLDNKIYVCEWDNLSKEPQVGFTKSPQVILLDNDFVVSIQKNPKAVVAVSLKESKKLKEISLTSDKIPQYLAANPQNNTVVVLLTETYEQQPIVTHYELLSIELETKRVSTIAIEKLNDGKLQALAVSNNGDFAAIVGEKNKLGWMALIKLKQKQKLWEKTLPDSTPFLSVAFSPENEFIYAGDSSSTLYKLDYSGKVIDYLRPPAAKKQSTAPVQNIAISSDGRFVAANFADYVNVWERESGKNIFSRHSGHKITSGVALSPDGQFLATSDVRQGGTIRIWRID